MKTRSEIVQGTSEETQLFLARRLSQLRKEIGKVCNINPFLMCALKDFHSIRTQQDLAEVMLVWHMGTGHSTSFGKMIDEKILPRVFRTLKLDVEGRNRQPYILSPFDDIDHVVDIGDSKYLLSLKASAWTIQYSQAMGLYRNFKSIGDQGMYGHAGVVVGVFYGNQSSLTDKYRVLRGINTRRQDELVRLEYVNVHAGKEFWSWLNEGEEATQDWVLEGIIDGTRVFAENTPDYSSIVGGAASRLAAEIRNKYHLSQDGDIDWFHLMHAINDPSIDGQGVCLDDFDDDSDEGSIELH